MPPWFPPKAGAPRRAASTQAGYAPELLQLEAANRCQRLHLSKGSEGYYLQSALKLCKNKLRQALVEQEGCAHLQHLTQCGRAQPAAVNLTLPADAPEDAAATAKCLEATLELWEDWHAVRARRLPPDLVRPWLAPKPNNLKGHAGAVGELARRARAPPAARPGAPLAGAHTLCRSACHRLPGPCFCHVCSLRRGARGRLTPCVNPQPVADKLSAGPQGGQLAAQPSHAPGRRRGRRLLLKPIL